MSYTAEIVRRQQIVAMQRLATNAEKLKPFYAAIGKRWNEIVQQIIAKPAR